MQREEELVEKLTQLNLEKEAKEKENQNLLAQLEDMRQKLESQHLQEEKSKRMLEEIQKKKAEKEKRKLEVERMRKERLKKQDLILEQEKRTQEALRKRIETEKAIRDKIITKVPLKTDEDAPKTGLNRSHSSPNIAKMMEQDDENSHEAPTPKFDRTR